MRTFLFHTHPERFSRGFDGLVDDLVVVGGRYETGLELRWRKQDAPFQHGPEKLRKAGDADDGLTLTVENVQGDVNELTW
jgi:hypothetical protein